MKLKKKLIKVFACPEGCRRKFVSLRALNNHITKSHSDVSYSVTLTPQSQGYRRHNKRARLSD